jgi:hypothetical protein
MGKGKVQETMASFVPPLMGSGSSIVMIIGSFQEFVAIVLLAHVKFFRKQ